MKMQKVDVGGVRAASGKAGTRNETAAEAPPPSFAAYVAGTCQYLHVTHRPRYLLAVVGSKGRTLHVQAQPWSASGANHLTPLRPSCATITADVHFAGDLSLALSAPLMMLSSIARSLDPRVGGGPGQAAAGPGAGFACAGPPPWEARGNFPFGANAAVQVKSP